jgi:hypothetical protein
LFFLLNSALSVPAPKSSLLATLRNLPILDTLYHKVNLSESSYRRTPSIILISTYPRAADALVGFLLPPNLPLRAPKANLLEARRDA